MAASLYGPAPDASALNHFLAGAMQDCRNGWSIGTFGAIAEFARDHREPNEIAVRAESIQMVSPRGGIRMAFTQSLQAFAYDTLSSDGETWGNALALCVAAKKAPPQQTVRRVGADLAALRIEDRDAILFDLGVGLGHVSMHVRTREPRLIDALNAMAGQCLLTHGGKQASDLMQQLSPHRVMTSPAGRIEVYTNIPPPDGKSPDGPHTHLLPKFIASSRTHSANAPIPAGLQPVLMMHPRSPWRDSAGRRTPYDRELDRQFDETLQAYGIDEDRRVRRAVEEAVDTGTPASAFPLPATRRARIQVRITLRRLAHKLGGDRVLHWRSRFDAAALSADDETEAPPP